MLFRSVQDFGPAHATATTEFLAASTAEGGNEYGGSVSEFFDFTDSGSSVEWTEESSEEDLDYFAALDVAAAEASPHAADAPDVPGPTHTKPSPLLRANPTFCNRPSSSAPGARAWHVWRVRGVRRSLRRSHVQGRKIIQVLRRLLSPLNRAPGVGKIKKLRCKPTIFIPTFRGRSRQKLSSSGCVRRPKILNLRSNQNSAQHPKIPQP